MRRYFAALALTLSVGPLAAQSTTRQPFPDDYTPNSCAQPDSCTTMPLTQMSASGAIKAGLNIDEKWITANGQALIADFQPSCRKYSSCLATAGNHFSFCGGLVVREIHALCERKFPRASGERDWDQCHRFAEVYFMGVNLYASRVWPRAQECAKAAGSVEKSTKLDVWIEPATFPAGYEGDITFYAIDPELKMPIYAFLTIEGDESFVAEGTPYSRPSTSFPFRWPTKLVRVPNAEGHTSLRAPMVTVKGEYYPPVQLQMPMTIPRMRVAITPAANKLRPGKNTVTVTAVDVETGKPVEARVMLGEDVLGETNQQLTIELPRGKRPDIWVTSYFDRYDDMVVVPAKR